MEILKQNSTGATVWQLQQDLQFLGYKISVDGHYGPGTAAAVVQFQKNHKLTVDGIAGQQTQKALSDTLSGVVQGIDISHLNDTIKWSTLSNDGISFVFCKASEGGTFIDPKFSGYLSQLKKLNMITGAYHFLHFQGATAEEQATNFLKCGLDFTAPGILPPVLDVEWQIPDSLNSYIIHNRAACAELIHTWLETIRSVTGVTPIIYSNTMFWRDYLGNPKGFEAYPLWIAAYQKAEPTLPPGWNEYKFWQITGNGRISSVTGDVDRNKFNGSLDDLRRWVNI